MKVSEALLTRRSCRRFLQKDVPPDTIRTILNVAARSPSGGNLQPWRVWVVGGEETRRLSNLIAEQAKKMPGGEEMDYAVFPPDMGSQYQQRLFKAGEDLYGALGIAREDSVGRYRQLLDNFSFFDAPVGIFFGIEKNMGPPQWSDLGMFIQSFMLLAREHGLHTCAQESWAMWPRTLQSFLSVPEDALIFCGMSLGWMDPDAPANQPRSPRSQLDEFAVFLGV